MNSVGYKIKKTILYILLILLGAACLFPFLLMVVNATRSGADIMTSFTLIPGDQLVNNWKTVFKFFNLFKGMANSIIVAVPATLFTAYFSALTAYGLAMYKFKGNKVLFTVILVFMMIPGQLSLIGFYNLCTKLKLVNSYIPLIVPAVAAPGTVFFLRQYILSVMPPALVEAARIDGCNGWQLFRYIYLPNIKSTVNLMFVMIVIGSFLAFDYVKLLTGGGPAHSTEVLGTYAYSFAFSEMKVGKAAAVGLFMSFFGLIASLIYTRMSRKENMD